MLIKDIEVEAAIVEAVTPTGFTGNYFEPTPNATTFKAADADAYSLYADGEKLQTCRFPVGRMNLLNPEESLCCGAKVMNPFAKRGQSGSYCEEHFAEVAVPNKEPRKRSGKSTRKERKQSATLLNSNFEDFAFG